MGPYMELIVPSSFYRIEAGLHVLSFSPGFNVYKKFDVFYFIDDIILLMLKLVSNKIDTHLTSLWRHERYLFSVFRGILPAIFRRFPKKLSTSVVVHQTIFYQVIKINFIFMLYNCYVPTYHRFLRQILLLKHQNVI
jgi:hypothetical protein